MRPPRPSMTPINAAARAPASLAGIVNREDDPMKAWKALLQAAAVSAALALSVSAASAVEAQALGAANVRAGPGTGHPVIDTLRAGEIVDVTRCNAANTWCRIRHAGPDGWVARSLLGPAGRGGVEFGVVIPLPGGGSIVFGTPGYRPPAASGPRRVCVYDGPNYTGARVCVNAGMADSNVTGFWNNRVSSLRTYGGARIRLCQNPGYGGFCNVFASDRPMLGGSLNNRASSYRVW